MSEDRGHPLCVRIADVTIGLFADARELRVVLDAPMRKFAVEETRPDVSVRAAWADLSRCETGGTLVFDSGSSWQLFRRNGGYEFRCHARPSDPVPFKVARFDAQFTTGEVLMHRAYFAGAPPIYPLDYPLDELVLINYLAHGRGVVVHGCGVADGEGKGLLFVGQSGAGKTTTARLWQGRPGVSILSDDRLVLRKQGDTIWMYGTPWHGTAEIAEAARVPLTAVYFLRHGARNELRTAGAAQAVARLLAAGFPPFHDADAVRFTVSFLEDVARRIPCGEFQFVPDTSAVAFIEQQGTKG